LGFILAIANELQYGLGMNGSLVRSDFLTAVIGNSGPELSIASFHGWRRGGKFAVMTKVTAGMLALEIATR
jgi:hypothetical protein